MVLKQVRRIAAPLAILLVAILGVHVPAAEAPKGELLPAVVEGTALAVSRPNGTRVEGQALVGAVVGGDAERGGRTAFRIDGLRPDLDDPEITLRWDYHQSLHPTDPGRLLRAYAYQEGVSLQHTACKLGHPFLYEGRRT